MFTGPGTVETSEPDGVLPRAQFDSVAGRWASGQKANAGDLGVLIMHELALTYAPAHRALYAWLEDWELGVYVDDHVDRDTLAQLWSFMAVLRDWINPLNTPGLRSDLSKAWLPAADHAEVVAVDDRIDRALAGLRDLGQTLRASFALLHAEQAEEQRVRSDQIQRRVEIAAAGFLIPTLVVGFYGANTWVPGQQAHWGFWVMVAVLILLSLGGITLVRRWHREQAQELERAKQEQVRLRGRLLQEQSWVQAAE
jgi:Mg2+ and Co2+ transporter CorA